MTGIRCMDMSSIGTGMMRHIHGESYRNTLALSEVDKDCEHTGTFKVEHLNT